ncbi:GTPase IMAP family member 4-like [Planoprotostelium fungivorum]|uniref:GTPase IMAP family member 4-like n=1 Tax=Planoprotostelium fungivorum TaxID=1890364 RepID=A0A2P6N2A5_9EUKA|nr:GTPase IMAP family member 4-like [Planoprotostelium fungivorum]
MNKEQRKITIALLGITGSGKSAIGSTIVNKLADDGSVQPVFSVSDSPISHTKECSTATFQLNGRLISVTDFQGVLDTADDPVVVRSNIVNSMRQLKTIDILLFVVKKDRLTEDTVNAILYIVEAILGPQGAKNSVLVITNSTSAQMNNTVENGKPAGDKWIREASINTELKALIDALNHRCIFVDNPQFNSSQTNPSGNPIEGRACFRPRRSIQSLGRGRSRPLTRRRKSRFWAWKASIAYEKKIREAEERLKAETNAKMREVIEKEVKKHRKDLEEHYDNKTKEFMRAHPAVERRSGNDWLIKFASAALDIHPVVGAAYCYGATLPYLRRKQEDEK